MEQSINNWQKQFEILDSDLTYVQNKLEQEFNEKYKDFEINPFDILQRIKVLQLEIPQLSETIGKVLTAKQELINEATFSLQDNTKKITSIQDRISADKSNSFQETQEDSDSVIIDNFKKLSTEYDQKYAHTNRSSENLNRILLTNTVEIKNSQENIQEEDKENNPTKSSQKKKTQQNSYQLITEEEFDNVSSVIKGRSTLDEINYIYETIKLYFQQQKAENTKGKPLSSALTIPELARMGLNVGGKTGQARLSTLRNLGKILITTRKDITMISLPR